MPDVQRKMTWFWAAATLVSFPLVLLIAARIGLEPLSAFLLGIGATFLTITVGFVLEGRIWMMDPACVRLFAHPEFSFRLAVLSGILLLLSETALLIFFLTSPNLDRALVNLVFNRQCAQPAIGSAHLCQALQTYYQKEAATSERFLP